MYRNSGFILLAAALWLFVPFSVRLEAADRAAAEQQMASHVKWIYDQLDKAIDEISPSAPDVAEELRRLNDDATEYLRLHDVRIPVANTLWSLTNRCNEAAVQRDFDRIVAVGKLHNAYVQINNELKAKRDNLTLLFASRFWAEGLINILTPPVGGWETFLQAGEEIATDFNIEVGMQMLEDYDTPQFKPLGIERLGKSEIPALAAEIKPQHLKLVQILQQVPQDKDDVVILCGVAQDRAALCEEKADRLYKKLMEQHEEVKRGSKAACGYVAEIAAKVDAILARQAKPSGCEISPDPIDLPGVGSKAKVVITCLLDSGLRRPAKSSDVSFDQDQPPLIEIKANSGGDFEAVAIASGEGELRVKPVLGGGTCATKVKVGAAASGSQMVFLSLSVVPSTVRLNPGQSIQIDAIVVVASGPGTPAQSNVTSQVIWGSDDDTIATVSAGKITAGASPGQCSVRATFTLPGGRQLTTTCSVQVSAASGKFPDVDFVVLPPKLSYLPGEPLLFSQTAVANPAGWDFIWYIGSEEANGPQIKHTFTNPGKYTVRLVLKSKATGEEDALAKNIVLEPEPEEQPKPPGKQDEKGTGSPPPTGPVARQINRFEARGAPADLCIYSSCWMADGWSPPVQCDRIGQVTVAKLDAGDSDNAYNTGFLVYVPAGAARIRYKVYDFNFNVRKGTVVHEGELDLHGKKPVPESLSFSECKSRAAVAEWKCTDGSLCRARLWKIKSTAGEPNSGVNDLGCIEGAPSVPSKPAAAGRDWSIAEAMTATAQESGMTPRAPAALLAGKEADDAMAKLKNAGLAPPNCMYKVGGEYPGGQSGGHIAIQVMASEQDAKEVYDFNRELLTAAGNKTAVKIEEVSVLGRPGYWYAYEIYPGAYDSGINWTFKNAHCQIDRVDKQKPPADVSPLMKQAETLTAKLQKLSGGRVDCNKAPQTETAGPVIKELTHGSGVWPARLSGGQLEVRGSATGLGQWKDRWVLVDRNVDEFDGVGTD